MKNPVIGEVQVIVMQTRELDGYPNHMVPVAVCLTEADAAKVCAIIKGNQRGEAAVVCSRFAPLAPQPVVFRAPLMNMDVEDAWSEESVRSVRRAIDFGKFREG